MSDYTNLGFRLEPSGGGSSVFSMVMLSVIALLLLFGVYQLYKMNSDAKTQNAELWKPIQLHPNQYMLRGLGGIHTKEKLMQLGLWRD